MTEFEILKAHIGHNIVVVGYGDNDEIINVSIECEDCNEVLYSIDKEEEMSKYFKIPVEWSVYGTVEIEANSMEDAIKIFDKTEDDIPLPTDNDYINGSFKRSSQETGDIEDDVKYYELFN